MGLLEIRQNNCISRVSFFDLISIYLSEFDIAPSKIHLFLRLLNLNVGRQKMAIPVVNYGNVPQEDIKLIEEVFHEATRATNVNEGLAVVTRQPAPAEAYLLLFTGFKGFKTFTMLSFRYPLEQFGSVDQRSLRNSSDFNRTVQYLKELINQTPRDP